MKVSQKVNYLFSTKKTKIGPLIGPFLEKMCVCRSSKKSHFLWKVWNCALYDPPKIMKNIKNASIVKGIKRVFPKTNETFTSAYYVCFTNKCSTNSVCSGHKVCIYFYRFVMGINCHFFLIKLLFFAIFDHFLKVIRWWNGTLLLAFTGFSAP